MAPERPGPDDSVIARGGLVPTLITKQEEENTLRIRCNGEDDDLTSLTWLVQDKNLLKGINLKTGHQQTSPTSDFAEDGSIGSDRSESSRGSVGSSGTPAATPTGTPTGYQNGKSKQSQFTHYDPMVHVKAKPPYSFSCLIFMAIEDSAVRALPVKEIYAWIQNHFPFYRDAPAGWKNSVRHNLSLNKCFSKVEKAPNLGKGSLWMVDPAFRPNLLQSMSKAPLTSFNFLERRNNNSSADLKVNGLSPNSLSRSSEKAPTKSAPKSNSSRSSRLPNPELFPFLSQRLAASGVGFPSSENNTGDSYVDSDDELEDVDAATAILTLKHGPRVIIPSAEDVYKRKKISQATTNGRKSGRSGRVKKRIAVPVITSSPSEDHTYSAGPSASSPDEAYGEGSDTDDSRSDIYEGRAEDDSEEQRRIAEGAADALLNLAGVASRIKREIDDTLSTQPTKRIRRQRYDSPRRASASGPNRGYDPTRHRSRDVHSDMANRSSVTHADIMADLEVIRNNNNNEISKSESLKEKSSSTGRIKVKYPISSFGDRSSDVERSTVIKRVAATGRKRKQWLSGSEPASKKGRR